MRYSLSLSVLIVLLVAFLLLPSRVESQANASTNLVRERASFHISQTRASFPSAFQTPLRTLLATHVSSRQSAGDGLTLDPCESADDCSDPRFCIERDSLDPCDSSESCLCAPLPFQLCTSNSQCPDGEVCTVVTSAEDSNPLCVSEGVFKVTPGFEPVSGTSLTGEKCALKEDCLHPRLCLEDSDSTCSSNSKGCLCEPRPLQSCSKTTQCVPGELCAQTNNGEPVCISNSFVDNSSCFCEVGTTCDDQSCEDISPTPVASPGTSPTPVSSSKDPTPTPAAVGSGGLTWDPCETTSDCRGERNCKVPREEGQEGPPAECDGEHYCRCFPRLFVPCRSIADCVDEGEVCTTRTDIEVDAFCASEAHLQEDGDFVEVKVTPPPNDSSGLTWARCATTSDCQGERICRVPTVEGEEGPAEECDGEPVCRCFPQRFIPCGTNADCKESGEICIERTDLDPIERSCMAEEVEKEFDDFVEATTPPTPSSSPTEVVVATGIPDEPCIDARALQHVDRSELIYGSHILAKVLCDSNNSCATPAHVVMHEQKPLMMQTYCKIVGCVEKEMEVNSPRYRRRLLVDSKTTGLKFTAFAARYGTRVEEKIISYVIRLGF